MMSEELDRRTKRRRTLSCLVLPLSVIYLELLLRALSGWRLLYGALPLALLAALGFACLGNALCALPRSQKAASWVCFACLELLTLCFVLSRVAQGAGGTFLTPSVVFGISDSEKPTWSIVNNIPAILLFHIPAVLLLIFRRALSFGGEQRAMRAGVFLGLAVFCLFAGYGANLARLRLHGEGEANSAYDAAVRDVGLLFALERESLGGVGESAGSEAALIPPAATPEAAPAPEETPEVKPTAQPLEEAEKPEEEEKEEETAPVVSVLPEEKAAYGQNVMALDFTYEGWNQEAINDLNAFVRSRTPSSQNRFTGLFAGKNLILITAESFSKELIDEERTPALYRLASKGIVFEDFYQPAWGGSSSTGEYSFLMGLAPTEAAVMMTSADNNHYFTLGNQLQRQGYFSRAYYDGNYRYYDRNLTHENLGYEEFIAIGSGLEEGIDQSQTPASDQEMFAFSLEQYIDRQPFSVYYMTASGHGGYAFSDKINDMSVKNEAVTEGMTCSDTLRAYYACNQELEYALETLLEQLEEAGILNDTVIALVADHYPYRLSTSWNGDTDCLTELYGYDWDSDPARDHSAAILWCGSLEALEEPIVVSAPCSSLDMLPTLSNLFGLEFDSRLMVGRDVFSGEEALVFWNDGCWLTEKGYYSVHDRRFYPNESAEVDEAYVERHTETVKERLEFSAAVAENDYYGILFR